MDYINLLHASGIYEKQTAKIIPFRSIDIFENAVSAGTGNFLVAGPKDTIRIDESILPKDTTFGVRISGDSMEPREQRGIYQDELAEATGYCTKTIERIERGESTPSAEFMLRISKYFNMMVEDVFHVEE